VGLALPPFFAIRLRLTIDHRINPLKLASAFFLVVAPFLTWVTIVSVVIYQGFAVFGTAAQSNLLMVSSQELGTNITQASSIGATASMFLLPTGGLAMLKSAKAGVLIASAGLLAYLIPSYATFGTQTYGYQLTFISPGIGLFVAGAGLVMGSISFLKKSSPIPTLLASLHTRSGLATLGACVGSVGLSLDILNHAALGQLSDFVGSGVIEQALHLGLVAGIGALLLTTVFATRNKDRYLLLASLATMGLLGADLVNSSVSGSIHDFLGHNPTETVLHVSVYYGIALSLVGILVGKRTE
jgi:hypothetical protein